MSDYTKFETATANPSLPDVKDISPEELLTKLDTVALIDVREPDEYTGELSHIPGATLLPLGDLPKKSESLPNDKTIVFICRSGGRSGKAASYAHSQNLSDSYNLKGGMLEWNRLGFKTE